MALNDSDWSIIENQFGESDEMFCAGAARLYSSDGSAWDFTGIFGAAVLISNGNSYFLKIVSLDVCPPHTLSHPSSFVPSKEHKT